MPNQFGMPDVEDLPQTSFANGSVKNLGIHVPQGHAQDGASYDKHLSTSVNDIWAGTDIEKAVDPRSHLPIRRHELKDDTIVYVRGRNVSLPLRDAKALGWINTGPFDNQAVVPEKQEAQSNQEQEKPEEHPDLKTEAFDNGGPQDLSFDEAVAKTDAYSQLHAIHQIVAEGAIGEDTLKTLGSQMGLEKEQAQAKLDGIMSSFRTQAEGVMSEIAPFVDAETISEWAWNNHGAEFAEAQKRHATHRKTTGYRDLATRYVETLDRHCPDMILGAAFGEGVKATNEQGKIIIRTDDGRSYPWRTAIKAGIIRLSRANKE